MPKTGHSAELNAELESLIQKADKMDIAPGASIYDNANWEEPRPSEKPPQEKKEPESEEDEAKTGEEDEESPTEPETSKESEEEEEEEDSKKAKGADRFDRNWKAFQEEKERIREENRALKERLEKLEDVKSTTDPVKTYKDKHGFTAEQYERHADALEQSEEYHNALLARKAANDVRTEAYQADFRDKWSRNQQEMLKANPDLGNMNSDLAKETEKAISENVLFRSHPDGVKVAVLYAKAVLDSRLVSGSKAKITKLEQEIARLNELAAPGGGGTTRKPKSGKSFEELSTKEMREHLMRNAQELDNMR